MRKGHFRDPSSNYIQRRPKPTIQDYIVGHSVVVFWTLVAIVCVIYLLHATITSEGSRTHLREIQIYMMVMREEILSNNEKISVL